MLDLEVLMQKTKSIVFRRQKNFVCSSVIAKFVSKIAAANLTCGTMICVRVTCVLNRTITNILFYKCYLSFVFIWLVCVEAAWVEAVPSTLVLFFSS